MGQHIGLDVSLKDTALAIRQDGKRIWRGKCPSAPRTLARTIRKHAPEPQRVVFETGPLATWLFHALAADGLPAVCIEARHAQKILRETLNKTDPNDADGLAQLEETDFYKAVRVKSFDAMLIRTLVGARILLLTITTQIRGVPKTFGLIVLKGIGRVFDFNVRELLEGQTKLVQIILPLLDVWHEVRERVAAFTRQVLTAARQSSDTKLLMMIPGIGAITVISYVAAIETSQKFPNFAIRRCLARPHDPPLSIRRGGLYSRRGDNHLRGLLYEAATAVLTITSAKTESDLKTWGLQLRERLGFKRAAVAVARKLAVITHTMLKTGEPFNPSAGGIA